MQFKRLNIIKRHDFDKLIKSYEKIFPELFKQFEDINRKMNESEQKEEKEKERSEEEIYGEFTDYIDKRKRRNNNKFN